MNNILLEFINDLTLIESKEDQQKFIDKFGNDNFDLFWNNKKKFKPPYNDIYYWIKKGNEKELIDFISNTKSKSEIKKRDKVEGSELILKDGDESLYEIFTYDAMKHFGKGTTWCIAGQYQGHEERGESYFEDYLMEIGSQSYYVVITPHEKFCILCYNNNPDYVHSVWNSGDNHINIDTFFDSIESEEITQFFNQFNPDTDWFTYRCGVEQEIPKGVKYMIVEEGIQQRIGYHELASLDSLVSVKIDYGVYIIESGAFKECTNLKEIEIPNSVEEIAPCAFADCVSLQRLKFPEVEIIEHQTCQNCSSLRTVFIPDTVTEIDDNAFMWCSSLKRINDDNTFSTNLKRIGFRAFSDCESLNYIHIPGNVKSIGFRAFGDCENLETIILDEGIEVIEDFAFVGCIGLTTIEIPRSVKHLGHSTFRDCYNLEQIICKNPDLISQLQERYKDYNIEVKG